MGFVHIGKVHSAQGIKGDLFIYIFAEEAAWADQWTQLFVAPAGVDQPEKTLEIKKLRPHQKQKKIGFVLKLDEIDDRNKADALVGHSVFVPEEFLVSKEGENIYLREVLGFRVHDTQRGDVGVVTGFSGHSMQDILVIKNDSGESFEVPFVEPILIEIKRGEQKIVMDIPQGLVAGEEL